MGSYIPYYSSHLHLGLSLPLILKRKTEVSDLYPTLEDSEYGLVIFMAAR